MAELAWPADLGHGTFVGRFGFMDADSHDPDREPDITSATGGTVTITPSARSVRYSGAQGPMILVARPARGVIDSEGYLCTANADNGSGSRGMVFPATDDTDLTPTDWTYEVSIVLDGQVRIPAFHVKLPTDATVDLSLAVPVPSSGGTAVVVDTTTADRAEAAAAQAEATVAGIDGVISEYVAATLPDDLVTADELTQALAGVKIDTSGLATTERVAQVEASIPEVVLRESALLDGETITSTRLETVEKADGSTVLLLVQTTNTGREVTAEVPSGLAQGAATYDSGFVDVSSWEKRNGVNAASAWLRRVGDRVTCVLHGADITPDAALIIPGDGYKIASYQDAWGDVRARGIRRYAGGTPTRPVFNGVAGGAFWPGTVEGTNSTEVVLEWFTDDPAPTGS